MRLVRQMDRRTSPREQPATTPRKQPALASSDEDISEEEKTAKTWGKKKATHEEEGQDYGKDVGQRGLGQ